MRNNGFTMVVGLRDVLEDVLEILKGGQIEDKRRTYVLNDLSGMFKEAMKGIALERQDSFFVGSANRKAFNTFQLFDQYLGHDGEEEWRDQLPIILGILENLKQRKGIDAKNKKMAEELFTMLLHQTRTRNFMGVPQVPKEICI